MPSRPFSGNTGGAMSPTTKDRLGRRWRSRARATMIGSTWTPTHLEAGVERGEGLAARARAHSHVGGPAAREQVRRGDGHLLLHRGVHPAEVALVGSLVAAVLLGVGLR